MSLRYFFEVFLVAGFLAGAFEELAFLGFAALLAVAAAGLSAAFGVEPTCLASWDLRRAALFGSIMPHLAALSIIENDLAIVVAETPFRAVLRAFLRRRLTSVFLVATRRAFLADLEIGICSLFIISSTTWLGVKRFGQLAFLEELYRFHLYL